MLPDEVKPKRKRGRIVLDLHTVSPSADLIVDVEQRAKQFILYCRAHPNRLTTVFSAVDTRGLDFRLKQVALKELAQSLPRLSALVTANIPQAPLIDPALLRQMSQVVPTIAASNLALKNLVAGISTGSLTGPAIGPALRRQMSQFGQTLAALNSVLNKQVAETLRVTESLGLRIPELFRSFRFTLPAPDPLVSDIIDAQDGDPSAAERVALRISWQPDQLQRACIRLKSRIEGIPPDEVRKKALTQGVILSLGWEKEGEVPIHIGPQSMWLYDDQQKLATVSPNDIPMQRFWVWLKEEAARAAGLWLVGQPYAPSVVLEAPPDQDGDWQLTRFTSLSTEEQYLSTLRGRPYGSGIFEDRQDFLEEIRLAVTRVKGEGKQVTQERVAEVLSERALLGSKSSDRQLRYWLNAFGYAGWRDLMNSL